MQQVGSTTNHPYLAKAQFRHDLIEESRAAKERLDKRHRNIRSRNSEHQPRESGTRTNVTHARACWDEFRHHGAVQ